MLGFMWLKLFKQMAENDKDRVKSKEEIQFYETVNHYIGVFFPLMALGWLVVSVLAWLF